MEENNMQQPGTTPDMTGSYGQQPVQPDMTGNYGQQPVQPDMTGYYGQQPVQPDVTGYYGQQPVQPDMTGYYGQQPVQPGGKPKKPMTKGKLGALIGAGAAVVALVVCGVIFLPRIFKSDKEVVLDAIEETIDSYSAHEELNDLVGYDDIVQTMKEKGAGSSLDLKFSFGENAAQDFGISISREIDQKKKELSGQVQATVGDSELIAADVYANEETMYVGIPEMYQGYLAYPTENTLQAIADSPLGQSMGLDVSALPSTSMNVFGQTSGGSGLTSGYVDALETIWDAAKFEKQGRAKITVNGETVTAKEYYVTWTKEDLQNACIAAIDGLTEAVTESDAALEDSGISVDDYKYYMEQIKAMVPTIIKNDLQVKVYVKGKKAVKLTCKDTINILMVKLDYDFWIDAGADDLSGNLSFAVSGQEAGIKFESHDVTKNAYGTISLFYGDNSIDLDFTKDVAQSGDVKTTTTKLSATDYLSVEWVKSYNKSDNSFEGSLSADIVGADTYVVEYKGGWKDIKKGKSYTVSIDSLDVKTLNKTICSASITESVDTSKIEVAPMDESLPVYDMASMTEDDLQKFADDNQDSIQAWADRISSDTHIKELTDALQDLFGGSADVVEDTEEDTASESDAGGTDELTLEDAVISTFDDAVQYKVNGTIDGFDFDYATSYSVSFSTGEYSTLTYQLTQAEDLQMAMDDNFYSMTEMGDEYDVKESNLNQTATVDGNDVLYNVEKYVAYGMNCMDFTAVTELETGVYLVETVSVYSDDDSFTEEQLLQGLSSKYFTKKDKIEKN